MKIRLLPSAAFAVIVGPRFYQLHTASASVIAPGMFDQSDPFEVAGQIYAANQWAWGPCDMTRLPHLDNMWNAPN